MQYKHKQTWQIANKFDADRYSIADDRYVAWCVSIYKELIENSSDRELIEEKKDWIDLVCKDYYRITDADKKDKQFWLFMTQKRKKLKETIELHMPQILKEELETILENSIEATDYDMRIAKLLKEKWLYKE